MSGPPKKILFIPGKKEVTVSSSASILDAARIAGILLPATCGGTGRCGRCLVKVVNGDLKDISDVTQRNVPSEMLAQGYVLACSERRFTHLTVEVPVVSYNFFFSEPHAKSVECAAAVDLGTTTIGLSLVDVVSRSKVIEGNSYNPQCIYGADVLSRVHAIDEDKENLRSMREMVFSLLKKGLKRAVKTVHGRDLKRAVVAGNTIMSYIFNGLSPVELTRYPFPLRKRVFTSQSVEMVAAGDKAQVHIDTVPVIGPFVGGDITAGLLAVSIEERPGPLIFVDLGTNAEIVLKTPDNHLVATSAPAGPAFEGGNIIHGMPAVEGAICGIEEKNDGFSLKIVGDRRTPLGICGSGLFAVIHFLHRKGIIDKDGTIRESYHIKSELGDRVVQGENGRAFVLFRSPEITITVNQSDIRNFQLAKSAVRSAIEVLLRKADVQIKDLKEIIVAGAMGLHITAEALVELNVLPPVEISKISFTGNAALRGCERIILDECIDKAFELAERVAHLELSDSDEFKKYFLELVRFGP